MNNANVGLGGVALAPEKDVTSPLLADVVVPTAESQQVATKLYRCGLQGLGAFKLCIQVAGVSFATATYWIEGDGEEAVYRKQRGALARLSDDELARLKQVLPFHYLRANVLGGLVLGYEHVDASDAGFPPKLLPGRLRGDETPLRDKLVLDVVKSRAEFHGVGSALHDDDLPEAVRQEEEEDLADLADLAKPDLGEAKARRGPRAKQLKEIATTTAQQTGSAGVIG